jgi:hypothetical protein
MIHKTVIVGAWVGRLSDFLLKESPADHVNCERARGRLYAEVLLNSGAG